MDHKFHAELPTQIFYSPKKFCFYGFSYFPQFQFLLQNEISLRGEMISMFNCIFDIWKCLQSTKNLKELLKLDHVKVQKITKWAMKWPICWVARPRI